jgi:hypothetical protein
MTLDPGGSILVTQVASVKVMVLHFERDRPPDSKVAA